MNHPYASLAAQGKTREDLVLEYAPLVKKIANRLSARLPDNLDVNDLIQAGMIGLLDAIEKYDTGREAQFRTYAEFRIRGSMLDDLRAGDWMPRSVRENSLRVSKAIQSLKGVLGRQPTEEEISNELNISMEEYHRLLLKSRTVPLLSIEDVGFKDEERNNVLDVLEDPTCRDPLESLGIKHLQETLAQGIKGLPEKEKQILSLYYDEDLNLKEIGMVLNITESRVSQIRTQAILRLRNDLKNQVSAEVLELVLNDRS